MAGTATQRHCAACSNRDYEFYYGGLERAELLIQRCAGCGTLRNPPSPMCGSCNSLEWTPARMSGRGTVHSYTIHFHPPLPEFPTPHPIALIDLDEGVRFLGAMDGVDPTDLRIGTRVEAEFLRRAKVAAIRFRIAR